MGRAGNGGKTHMGEQELLGGLANLGLRGITVPTAGG